MTIPAVQSRVQLNGWVAQLVEQRTENPRVAGSIPAPATFSRPGFYCRHCLTCSSSAHGRDASAAAIAEIAALIWAAAQHHHQTTGSRRTCPGAADPSGNDHRRVERAVAATE